MKDLKRMTDEELLIETKRAAQQERENTSNVLRHLREVERRRLFCGCGSLHEYAVKELKYTDDEAGRRISAMRTFREVPEVESQVMTGDLSMTHIGIARSIFTSEKKKGRPFTPEKKREVFAAMAGTSTREAKRIALGFAEEIPARPDDVRPLTDGRNLVTIEISDATLAKIEMMKGRLAHKHPHISMDDLLGITCDIALRETDPAREPKRGRAGSKAGVRRAVWRRDKGVCTECGSLYAIQADHRFSKCLGGEFTLENMRLLCRNCNLRAAITNLGQKKMDAYL